MKHSSDITRLLAPVLEWAHEHQKRAALAVTEMPAFRLPPDFTGRDYLSLLLHVDAEIEHGLMVQYLYSAYSLGGPQVPEQYQKTVQGWQELILGIAKEEMGHLITVENVLKLIGAPLNFDRQDYPWDTPFYPFPFTLGPLTLDSVARYVYAEAPTKWLGSRDPLAAEIKARVGATVSDPHNVGALFDIILLLVNDRQVIADGVFQPATLPFQAGFDEWGRGYLDGQRGNAHLPDKKFSKSPSVLVTPVLSRFDAYNALHAIAEQGEGEDVDEHALPSHFERFLSIYKAYKELLAKDANFEPARHVAVNPYVLLSEKPAESRSLVALVKGAQPPATADPAPKDLITDPVAICWARLFNLRYRMLLNLLQHSFLLDDGDNNVGDHAPRGLIIHAAFGEMYNLRTIAGILMQLPLERDGVPGGKLAGPPFQIPYTLDLPFGENNRWQVHHDLLSEAEIVVGELLGKGDTSARSYLTSLREIDEKLLTTIKNLHV